jgi:hypothetical protein
MAKRNASVGLLAMAIAMTCVAYAAQEPVVDYQGAAAEQFLLKAKIGEVKALGQGVTHPYRVELELDGVRHAAVFKSIDDRKAGVTTMPDGRSEVDFQDSWQTEIAAYHVDRIIGLGMVPATVPRRVDGKPGSLQWFIDGTITEEKRMAQHLVSPDEERWSQQVFTMRLFDQLIANADRNLGNILITPDFQIRLIDHSRSFRVNRDLTKPETLLRFSRSLLEGITRLEKKDLQRRVGDYLTSGQIDRLLQRRDAILALARKRVAEKGEAAVLFK